MKNFGLVLGSLISYFLSQVIPSRFKRRANYWQSGVLLIFALSLTACGGGGTSPTPPVVTSPADITVEATGAAGTAASDAAIAAFLAGSSAVDDDDPAPSFSHNAPMTFPLGDTLVTFTYTDSAGSAGSATATVTVSDTISPVVTAPADITVEAPGTAAIATFLAGSSSTDAVDPAPAVTTNAPTTFPLGATVVTFTHTDASGNAGTATATVTVSDTTPPVITLLGADPINIDLLSTFIDPGTTVTDAVDTSLTATVTGVVDTLTGGAYLLSYNATDTAGNVATTVTRTVNVVVATPIGVGFTVSGKHLNFTWSAITALDHYRISENPDGVSGFTVVPSASNIPATATGFSLEIPVHKTNWLSAQYIVEACDASETQCKQSPNQTLALIDSIAATFYIKSSNTLGGGFGGAFGTAVAVSGDGNTLAVGARAESSAATGIGGDQTDISANLAGAVYVFTRSGTTWVQQAYIKASNTDIGDQFGIAVSLSADGNTLAVGANGEDSNGTGIGGDQSNNTLLDAGAAYVFTRSGTTWTQQAYVKESNTAGPDRFGESVALNADGNTLAVGAVTKGPGGAVYVFTRSGTIWSEQAILKASNADTGANGGDRFGWTIAFSSDGNTLAVGAIGEQSVATGIGGDQTDNTLFEAGAAYVFTRSGTTWVQQAYIKASNTNAGDQFGNALSLSADGNTLAVGAWFEKSNATGIGGDQTNNTAGNEGAVYVFTRSGTTWTQQAYVKRSFNTGSDGVNLFGVSLSLSADGNTLAVGGSGDDGGASGVGGDPAFGAQQSGAAYVFARSGPTWTQQAYVKASNTGRNDSFGAAISLSGDGDTLAVGAIQESSIATGVGGDQGDSCLCGAGAVYLY